MASVAVCAQGFMLPPLICSFDILAIGILIANHSLSQALDMKPEGMVCKENNCVSIHRWPRVMLGKAGDDSEHLFRRL